MTHRLATNYAKNYCNQTPTVKVIVENVVTCFFWDTVYISSNTQLRQVEYNKHQLEIWGRAQLEAARHPKSDWIYNLWG